MKKHLAALLACAVLVSGGLFGLLSAVDHSAPVEPEDAWLDAFRAAGMKAELIAVSSEPEKHLGLSDARELAKGAAFQGTSLRRYIVQNVTVQVAILPRASLLPELPEGRHPGFRLKPKGSSTHLCRSGRNLLFVRTQTNWVPLLDEPPTPKGLVEKMDEVFERTAARFP